MMMFECNFLWQKVREKFKPVFFKDNITLEKAIVSFLNKKLDKKLKIVC